MKKMVDVLSLLVHSGSMCIRLLDVCIVLSVLKLDKKYQVPEDYSESFRKAIAVFHHARIYDPETKSLKPMKPLDQKCEQSINGELDILGLDLPSSMAAAIAEGHLNPVTMEAFDHFPNTMTCYGTENVPDLDQADQSDTQMVSTQDSCITVFSAHRPSKLRNAQEIVFDQRKYMKEAIALGKLVTPVESQQMVKDEAIRIEVPNNNPFKRRKLRGATSEERERCIEMISVLPVTAEGSSDILYSSPESQVTIESRPPVNVSIRKEDIEKKSVTKGSHMSVKSEKTGIFKFFQRL